MQTAKHQSCQNLCQVIPSASDTFLQGQLHIQADFGQCRKQSSKMFKCVKSSTLSSQTRSPFFPTFKAGSVSCSGSATRKFYHRTAIIYPNHIEASTNCNSHAVADLLLNISRVQGFQASACTNPHMFTLLALCWELEKELLLLDWSLRREEIADLFNLFKFQPHWTKIALVCRFKMFKAMSPPSGSVLDMFCVGLHHRWSPCPRNYSRCWDCWDCWESELCEIQNLATAHAIT